MRSIRDCEDTHARLTQAIHPGTGVRHAVNAVAGPSSARDSVVVPGVVARDARGRGTLAVYGQDYAHTFTAGLTGSLDRVDVNLYQDIASSVTVGIQSVDGTGAPSGTVLGREQPPFRPVGLPSRSQPRSS